MDHFPFFLLWLVAFLIYSASKNLTRPAAAIENTLKRRSAKMNRLAAPSATDLLPLPDPPTQVATVTPWEKVLQRCRRDALEHYLHAACRTVEIYFSRIDRGQGMDLRVALAILPDGQCRVDAELRPARLKAESVAALQQELESLPCMPVKGGPVVLLLHSLIWGGSDDPWQSFRHRAGPYFSNELPEGFADAIEEPPDVPSLPPPSEDSDPCTLDQSDLTIETLTRKMQEFPRSSVPCYWRGILHKQEEQFDAAIADFTECIARAPEDAPGYFQRGICRHATSNRELALADYGEAARRDPSHVDVLHHRARLFAELEAFSRALEDASAAIALLPEAADGHLLRGKIHASQRNFDLALADLDRALQLDPHHVEALFIRAMIYRDRPSPAEEAREDCKLAIAGFSAALRLNGDLVPAFVFRGQMRLQVDDLAGAKADCNEAIRRESNHGFAYAIRGHVHLREGNHRTAISDCTEAIRLGADSWLVQLALAEAHLAENEREEALAACDAAIQSAPQHAGATFLRARVQMQMGMLDAALEDATAAIALAPAWDAPHALRGNLHGMRGETENALADLDEALRLAPANAEAHYNRGVAWFHKKELDRTMEDLNEAEGLGFRAATLYFMRATVHLQQFQPERARPDLDEALRIDPEFVPALNTRANLFLQQGQHDAAMRDYEALIRLCPNVAAAYSSRAGAWLQLGEKEKAAEDFREAVQLDPGQAENYAIQSLLIEAAFHHNREEFAQAIVKATAAIDADAGCGPAYAIRAAAYWYSERHVEALDDYNQLFEMAERPTVEMLSGRGQVHAEMGEFQSALDDLNRAVNEESKECPPHVLAYALSGRALAHVGLGHFEEAERDFDSSLRNCPLNAWAHFNQGLMYHQLGEADAAAASFQLAAELREPSLPPRKRDRARGYVRRQRKADGTRPSDAVGQDLSATENIPIAEPQGMADAHIHSLLKLASEDLGVRRFVAVWALEKGRIAFAKEQAEAALSIEATDSKKYGGSHLGRILRGLVGLWEKNWTEAECYFQKVLTESPNDFTARNNIALALVEQDDPEKKQQALDYAEANSCDGSKNTDVLSTLGWVHFRREEFDQAETALDQAAKALGSKLDPDTATYLAHIRHHCKRVAEAKEILEKALNSERSFSMRPEALKLYEAVTSATTQSDY